MENQFENERQEYEKTITALEEQSEKREQKYSVRSNVTFYFDSKRSSESLLSFLTDYFTSFCP